VHLLLMSDLPGVSGIDRATACLPGSVDYDAGLAARQAELAALVTHLRALGASAITVVDWHAWHPGATPLTPAMMPDGVTLFDGALSQRVDVAIAHGLHAMTGAEGFCSQTFAPNLTVTVNGQPVGELALLAWWLGEQGIPLALVAGDRALSQEAERWTEQTTTVTVKRATRWDTALTLPLERAAAALQASLERVLARREFWWVYRPPTPLAITVEWDGVLLAHDKAVSSLRAWLTALRRRLGATGS
jgi:D-aminopeptidase